MISGKNIQRKKGGKASVKQGFYMAIAFFIRPFPHLPTKC